MTLKLTLPMRMCSPHISPIDASECELAPWFVQVVRLDAQWIVGNGCNRLDSLSDVESLHSLCSCHQGGVVYYTRHVEENCPALATLWPFGLSNRAHSADCCFHVWSAWPPWERSGQNALTLTISEGA
eukprot:183365-Amphidinium_carterae.2